MNGWVECKVLAEGKLQHGKWATNGATNDVLPQEAATVKALTDLCPGRTIQMWDGLPNTDLFQYREKNKILRTVASCNGEMSGEDAPVEDASVAVSESERQPPAKEEESKISPLSAPIRPLNTIQGEDGAVISGRGGSVT